MNVDRRAFKVCQESNAFSLEYQRDSIYQALEKDIHTYLAEYRFQVPRADYELTFSGGQLRDIHGLEPMVTFAQKAIKKREVMRKNTDREKAELSGLQLLDKQIEAADLGDRIIWASPPGLKEDGYGDYGFFFVGTIDEVKGTDKHISMSALRVEDPETDKMNRALTDLTGIEYDLKKPEDFLALPLVTHRFNTSIPYALSPFSIKSHENNQLFDTAMRILEPAISSFIHKVKQGANKAYLKLLFNSIENMAVKIVSGELKSYDAYDLARKISMNPDLFFSELGYTPPVVRGSCGDTGDNKSSNIFEQSNLLKKILKDDDDEGEDEFGPLRFDCGQCGQKHTRPRHELLKICPTNKQAMKKC